MSSVAAGRVAVPFWVTSPHYSYGEFNRIARCLMSQNVEFAEMTTQPPPPPPAEGEVAFRLIYPDAPHENGYMIASRHAGYTVPVLPEGFDGEVRTLVIEKDQSRYLLRRLRCVARFMERRQHDLFVAADIEGRLAAIERCYAVEEAVPYHAFNALVARAQAKAGLNGSFADLIVGLEAVINAATLEFHQTRVDGHTAQKVIAVLYFFSLHPERESLGAPVRDRTVPARRPPARNIGHLPKHLPRYDEVIEPESNRAKAKIGMANITYNLLRYAFHECRRATA